MKPDKDWRPITPEKVADWMADLEDGRAKPGFLGQLAASHRELYEKVHGAEPPEAGQLPLFGG